MIDDIVWRVNFEVDTIYDSIPRPSFLYRQFVCSEEYHYRGWDREELNRAIFQYSLKGQGILLENGRRHVLDAGTGFLFNNCDPNVEYYYEGDGQEPWELIFISFENMTGQMAELVSRLGMVHKVPLNSPLIYQLLNYHEHGKMDTYIHLTAGDAYMMCSRLIGGLMDHTYKSRFESTSQVLVRRARQLIDERIEEPLNVSGLAELLGVSSAHLCRVFKAETGQSPNDYLSKTKVRRAAHLLRTTGLSIKEIHCQLGFDSSSHFARLFRRVVGISPREFRLSKAPILF